MTQIIDLSVPLGASPSEPLQPEVVFERHADTAPFVAGIFGCAVSDLPDGQGWANERVTAISHAGTHVDAPYHYFPTCGGERARTIDELPLDWFVRPGVRIDLRDVAWGSRIEVADLERALDGVEPEPYDIVLLWTGADARWGEGDYVSAGSGLGRESTLWLLDRGVRVIGTDAWGLDWPLLAQRQAFERDRDPSILWEAHRVGIEREYCQIEKLCGLGGLPGARGFTVSALPVKLAGASAGWCRAVAIVP